MTYFKLCYSIQKFKVPDGEIEFILNLVHPVTVKIYRPDKNYLESSQQGLVAFCDASMSIPPNTKNSKLLNDIIEGNVEYDIDSLDLPYSEMTNHHGKKIIIPRLDFFPDHFQTFVSQIATELRDAIKRTITILRWYLGKGGPHNPFANRGFQWTLDEVNWYSVPNLWNVSIIRNNQFVIELTQADNEIVSNLIDNQDSEPIYHSLFRESWDQKSNNPRSSIIMAISAVEVALKQLIEKIVPDAKWLVSKLQSPPIYLIFNEYLRELDIDNKIDGVPILPTSEMTSNLRKWVAIRNEITHLGKEPLNSKKLKEMLLTIKDILHIIDFNYGYKWSIVHIRKSTLEEIGIVPKNQNNN